MRDYSDLSTVYHSDSAFIMTCLSVHNKT